MSTYDYAIGIDLGGTHIKLIAATLEGKLLQQLSDSTADCPNTKTHKAYTREAWVQKIQQLLAVVALQQACVPHAIGISAPGLPSPDGRSIAWMQGRMEALQGIDWAQQFGCHALIPVVNDAQAALLGEVWQGAARGKQDVVLLTLGTGVGGGILCDGRLLRGHIGRAGHLGHISLNPEGPLDIVRTPGSLEDAIGECTLLQRSDGRFASTLELVAAVGQGDAHAQQLWHRSIRALAVGIVSIVNAVDPSVVIIGGGIAKAGAALFVPLQQYVDEFEWCPTQEKVRIVPARLGEFAGAWGAAYNALQLNTGI
ncbi:MAG: glucokinase [Abditibacteriota bacterium]|nr:glucokinase [Abditibacteriota bacterium]